MYNMSRLSQINEVVYALLSCYVQDPFSTSHMKGPTGDVHQDLEFLHLYEQLSTGVALAY